MPTVPIRTGASVQQAPLQGGLQAMQRSNASPELLSGNAEQLAARGQALGNLSQGLGKAANDFDVIAERQATDEAFRAEIALKSAWMQTDAELRKRYRGNSVDGYRDEADKWWQEAPAKFGADISSRARGIASRSMSAAKLQAESSSLNYFTGEKEKSQNESWEAAKGVVLQEALTDMRPEVIATARKNLEKKNIEFAATRGWTTEQLKLQNVKDANLLHTTMIGKMIDDNPIAAKAYYEANRDEVDATRQAKIEKDISGAVNEVEGKRVADSLVGKPYEEIVAEIAKITDPAMRKSASLHARQNHADVKEATAQKEKAASDKVWQAVAKGASMGQLPRSVLDQMDGKERVQLNEHYRAEAKRRVSEAEGKPIKTDMAKLEDIYSMPREDFLKLRISTLSDKLSRGDTEELIKRQAALRDPKKALEVVSMEQQIAATKTQLRLKDEQAGAFTSAVYNELNAAAKVAGKELDYDQRQKVIDRLTIKKDSWFSNQRRFEVVGTDKQVAFDAGLNVKEIPARDKQLIGEALKRAGQPVTDAAVMQMFRANLNRPK